MWWVIGALFLLAAVFGLLCLVHRALGRSYSADTSLALSVLFAFWGAVLSLLTWLFGG